MTAEYHVEFRPEAVKDLSNLDAEIGRRVLRRMKWLSQNFDVITPEPLTGKEWRGVFKLRVGAYRVLYTVKKSRRVLTVLMVGHRRDIYRIS